MKEAEPDWLTMQQAADLIGVSKPRVSQLVKSGKLSARRFSGVLMILPADAEAYRDTPRKPGRPPATPPKPAKGRRKG